MEYNIWSYQPYSNISDITFYTPNFDEVLKNALKAAGYKFEKNPRAGFAEEVPVWRKDLTNLSVEAEVKEIERAAELAKQATQTIQNCSRGMSVLRSGKAIECVNKLRGRVQGKA
jgi:hypothetical protein